MWDKREDSSSMAGLAAWDTVCRPKDRGGLGVKNLALQNTALLLKQLHKFFSKLISLGSNWLGLYIRMEHHRLSQAEALSGGGIFSAW